MKPRKIQPFIPGSILNELLNYDLTWKMIFRLNFLELQDKHNFQYEQNYYENLKSKTHWQYFLFA